MNRSLRTRLIVVVLTALLGTIATVAAGWSPSLGLDLQGGTSVVLEPKGDVKPDVLDRTIGIIRSRVDSLGVAEPDISRQGKSIVVSLPGLKDPARALAIVGKTAQLTFRPVLSDVPSENESKAQAAGAKTDAKTTKTVTVGATTTIAGAASTTLNPKATPTTVAAPSMQALAVGVGPGRYSVAAPVATPATTTVAAAPTTTAKAAGGATTTIASGVPVTTIVPTIPDPNLPTSLDTTGLGEDSPEKTVILPEKRNDPDSRRYLLGPAEVQGAVVDTASAVISPSGQWTVDLRLNGTGAALWDAMAEKNYQQRIAIVLDGEALSAPVIQTKRFGGRAEISGSFKEREAKDLATALKFGSLPVTLEPQTVQSVSASLGKDSLRAGLLTGLIGLLLVACYMVFYYRKLGFVVVLGLMVSGGLMWTLVSFLSEKQGLALSLSGVVGIIVSFGTTVDSYVVFFERMRDEMRAGRNVAQSVERGFKSAFRTIIAADFTSLIGAAVLYFLTVGSVRGFALFLLISTTLDLIVAWAFTRPIVTLIAEQQMKRNGFVGGAGSGPSKLTPSGGRLIPGSATQGAQL
jgi:preprotein translocase subunit SecD